MAEQPPTDRELEILKLLWERRQATVREVCDAMNTGGAELAYTTVLSLLQIMERKNLVRHKKQGKAYLYAPRVQKEGTIRRLTSGFVSKVFDGAVDEFVLKWIDSQKLSAEDLDRLEQHIANSRKSRQKNDRRREGPK